MTSSRTDGRFAGAAAGLAFMLVLGGASLASSPCLGQDGQPTSLLPPSDSGESAAPSPVSPFQAPSENFPEVPSRGPRIQVQDLGAPSPGTAGVLDQAHGGFGTQMWAGTSMAVVLKVLPDLPATAPSPAMHALMRRLLLTGAALPQGNAGSGTDPLIGLRAERLWAMGEVKGLLQLLKGIPASAMTPDAHRAMVEAALLAGDDATACADLPNLLSSLKNDPFPVKVQVYCQIASGKANEAGLGVDLLREQKVSDPIFFAAADTSAGIGAGKLGNAWASASPLDLAMARIAKLSIPETAVLQTRSPALLGAIAVSPGFSPETRLAAAEKAAATGVVDVDALRQIYDGFSFSPQELAAPAPDKSPRGRALLYRAATQQSQPSAKAEIIAKALGEEGDTYLLTARIYAPQIAGMRPQPELAWFAFQAARALYAAGQTEAANVWAGFARGQSFNNPELAGQAAGLWMLRTLAAAEGDKAVPAALVEAWIKARPDLQGEARQRRIAVCLGLLSAVGAKVPDQAWLPLFDGPATETRTLPGPGLWQGLRVAAENLRVGEVVMMSLASLGDGGLAKADPSTLYRVVASLRLAGLDADARALAVEAAIVNGV